MEYSSIVFDYCSEHKIEVVFLTHNTVNTLFKTDKKITKAEFENNWHTFFHSTPIIRRIAISKNIDLEEKFIAALHEIGHVETATKEYLTINLIDVLFNPNIKEEIAPTIQVESVAWLWVFSYLVENNIDLTDKGRTFILFCINTYWQAREIIGLEGHDSPEWGLFVDAVGAQYDDVLNKWELNPEWVGLNA